MTPCEQLAAKLTARNPKTVPGANGNTNYSCPGPNHAHGDRNPSLSVRESSDGAPLLYCFAGCQAPDIVAALGLRMRDLFDAEYRYDDGRIVHRSYDAEGHKAFRQSGNTKGTPTLAQRQGVLDAVRAGQAVYLVEGEKDVHALEAVGVVATTAPMGAGNFAKVDVEPLRGAHVVAVVDKDQAGDKWARQVRDKVEPIAARLTFKRAADGKDAADHVAAGHGVDELVPCEFPDAGHDDQDDADDGPRSTWECVDIGATIDGLLNGTVARMAPTVGRLNGGGALFYRGRVNGLAGESGSGKTWTALHVVSQELGAGEDVVYVDHEDDAVGIVARLLDLGADPDTLRARFHYLNPAERPTDDDLTRLAALVAQVRPTLVVIDSTGEGLALEGANPSADEEVATWFVRIPRRLAKVDYDGHPGPAVLVLDHVTKAGDGGLWPIGSHRKRAAINGAQYMQRLTCPFSQDTAGTAALVCAKDRHGNYRAGQKVAELNVTPGPSITLDAITPTADRDSGQQWRPTKCMEKVSRVLEGAVEPLSQREITKGVCMRPETVRVALGVLAGEGYAACQQKSGANLHKSVRPYREDQEPRCADGASGPVVPGVSRPLQGRGAETPETVSTVLPGNTRETLGKHPEHAPTREDTGKHSGNMSVSPRSGNTRGERDALGTPPGPASDWQRRDTPTPTADRPLPLDPVDAQPDDDDECRVCGASLWAGESLKPGICPQCWRTADAEASLPECRAEDCTALSIPGRLGYCAPHVYLGRRESG